MRAAGMDEKRRKMTNEQLQIFLDRHGSDPERWPQSKRAEVEWLVAHSAEARAVFELAQKLDAALARHAAARAAADAAIERVLTRLEAPLPRQQASLWRLPPVLLDWQFAPAWPRMAALACCAVLGFAIGIAGLDRLIERFDRITVAANTVDMGSALFEPEPLIGVRP